MEQTYKIALDLVKAALYKEDFIIDSEVSWKDIYQVLHYANLSSLTYQTAENITGPYAPDQDVLTHWKQYTVDRGFLQVLYFGEESNVLQNAKKLGLHPVVFKGIALATLYPNPGMRFSSDADILIPSKEASAMGNLLLELGYSLVDNESKDHVPVYKIYDPDHMRFLKIELHDCLWEDYTGFQADLLEKLKLSAPETLIETTACDIPITTLGYEQHLIYQIFHIAKHFIFERLPLRYLTDLTLYVNAYHDKIDSAHFWDIMKQLKYDVFCDAFFKICVQYLGMTPNLLSDDYKEYELNETLLYDILIDPKLNGSETRAWDCVNTLAPYLMRDTKLSSSSFTQKLHQIFPSPSELNENFSYAKKHRILLPIAWIHRFYSALSYSRYCKKNGVSAMNSYNKIDRQLQLMKNLKMIDTK